VVKKGERRLLLMHGSNTVRSYHIALGLSPVGQKERSGDFRTPEGSYRLEQRNPRSDYFLSIKVSYPNETDLKRARARHWDTGGSIMIHGLPNFPEARARVLRDARLDRRLHRGVGC
jgi:murein L,D-transpeptidase YafK